MFSTFTDWADEGDEAKIEPVLAKFAAYCQPRKNIPFERYRFNRRVQEPGESYDQYRTALCMLAEGCDFQTITPGEILRDRLVFGIKDKVRERLLRESTLTLSKTDEICRAAESMAAQMKVVSDTSETTINAVKSQDRCKDQPTADGKCRECWNCGHTREYHKKELCPAYGKTCHKCQKPNHFAVARLKLPVNMSEPLRVMTKMKCFQWMCPQCRWMILNLSHLSWSLATIYVFK